MQQFFVRRWFLIILVVVLTAGFSGHSFLGLVATHAPKNLIVAVVLFFMSLPLDARAMWRALRHPWPALLATGVNLIVVPIIAWIVSPLLPEVLGIGLIIMATIPCTLASAAVWTRRAGGNDAVALMVTMVTNLACFIVTPAWIRVLMHSEVSLDYYSMTLNLFLFVVLPILIAQLCRISGSVANWATKKKLGLSIISQCGILSIVLIGSINGGARLASGESSALHWSDWALMLLAVNFVHLAALAIGHLLAKIFRMQRADRIAVGFAGSQKTLAIGLAIGTDYFNGLTILPMIAYHVCQLLMDTLVVDYLQKHAPEAEPEQPTPKPPAAATKF